MRIDADERSDLISNDIDKVIDAKVDIIARDFEESDRRTISKQLKCMEGRTYLWLRLTFDIFEQNPSKYSRQADVEALLSSLPSKVSEAYEQS
jgi:hypothetical protein